MQIQTLLPRNLSPHCPRRSILQLLWTTSSHNQLKQPSVSTTNSSYQHLLPTPLGATTFRSHYYQLLILSVPNIISSHHKQLSPPPAVTSTSCHCHIIPPPLPPNNPTFTRSQHKKLLPPQTVTTTYSTHNQIPPPPAPTNTTIPRSQHH